MTPSLLNRHTALCEPINFPPNHITHITMSQLNLEIKTKLDALQQALLDSNPSMPTLLRDIHITLKSQPEQVTLMTEQELYIVIQGLEKQTNTYLAASTVKSSKSATGKAKLKNATAADLGFD